MTRFQAWISGLFLVSCALSHGASAQQRGVSRAGIDSLKAVVGFRVRVRDVESSSWQTGTLGSVNDETLVVRGRHDEIIHTADVVAAQRSLGHASYNPTMVGFMAGLVIGGTAGYIIGSNVRPNSSASTNQQRSVGLAIGAATGAGLGALIGKALAHEHWRDIWLR